MDDKETGIELGKAYVFLWPTYDRETKESGHREMTGIAVRISGKSRWVSLRTGKFEFKVPPQDVLRRADDH
jgi:hypothetical protein